MVERSSPPHGKPAIMDAFAKHVAAHREHDKAHRKHAREHRDQPEPALKGEQ